jgi:hypothetical protein
MNHHSVGSYWQLARMGCERDGSVNQPPVTSSESARLFAVGKKAMYQQDEAFGRLKARIRTK